MGYVREELTIIATSDPLQGAQNIDATGSRFELVFDEPMKIPHDAIEVYVSAEESSVWFVTPNIITGVNDTLYVTGPSALDVVTPYVVTIPQGLYSLEALSVAIARELETAGAKTSPLPIISLSGDDATQRAVLTVNYATVSVDFTPADTFRDVIGFNSGVVGPFGTVPSNQLAPNAAAFNTVNYYLIHSDLVTQGIRFGTTFSQVISQVLITGTPGNQIVSTPFNPPRVQAQYLAGATRSRISFWLTDERQALVETNGEYWTVRIRISWLRPAPAIGSAHR